MSVQWLKCSPGYSMRTRINIGSEKSHLGSISWSRLASGMRARYASIHSVSPIAVRQWDGRRSSRDLILRATADSTTPSLRRLTTPGSSENLASIRCSVKSHSPGHNVATLTVTNPTKLNIINSALLSELQQHCRKLSQDSNLRAVILTGGEVAPGKASSFIGGADITEMIELSSAEQARSFILQVHLACKALRDLPVPVIARVNGFCLGAGLEMAAACDLRIATSSSVFGMPEVKVGIPSVVEAALLPSLIGTGRTRRLLYLAENISATEAEKWGLVEKVVSEEAELDRFVGDWTEKLVGMGPKAVRSQKTLMQKWENCSVDEGIMAGVEAYAQAYEDGGIEPKEFMGRFVKRSR